MGTGFKQINGGRSSVISHEMSRGIVFEESIS